MATSTWRCTEGHVWTSPRKQEWCPYPKCSGEPTCTRGPHKPKAPK